MNREKKTITLLLPFFPRKHCVITPWTAALTYKSKIDWLICFFILSRKHSKYLRRDTLADFFEVVLELLNSVPWGMPPPIKIPCTESSLLPKLFFFFSPSKGAITIYYTKNYRKCNLQTLKYSRPLCTKKLYDIFVSSDYCLWMDETHFPKLHQSI